MCAQKDEITSLFHEYLMVSIVLVVLLQMPITTVFYYRIERQMVLNLYITKLLQGREKSTCMHMVKFLL